MVVLSAIGRFFKKIWDWIKQTAWIQPLLIVGIIFGVIFSIPSIVDAFDKAKETKNSADTYFQKYQLSLEGGENSAADKLTKAINDNKPENFGFSNKKFFLMYVEEGSSECEGLKQAFTILESKLGKGEEFPSDDHETFKLVTIYTDQETTSTTKEKSAFTQYLENNEKFINTAFGNAEKTDYFLESKKLDESTINNILDNMTESSFHKPTIMLVDMNLDNDPEDFKKREYEAGVTEIVFNVTGSSDYDKASFLCDCWNHKGDFNVNKDIED